jgi:hypothetical protein
MVEGSALGKTNSFFLASRGFATRHARVLGAMIAGLGDAARWAESHRDRVASALAEVTGIDLAIQTVAANRATFAIGTLTDDVIATQQAVADRFHRLGLIPGPWPSAKRSGSRCRHDPGSEVARQSSVVSRQSSVVIERDRAIVDRHRRRSGLVDRRLEPKLCGRARSSSPVSLHAKNTRLRSSMLRRGGASGRDVGSSNAVCADSRTGASALES